MILVPSSGDVPISINSQTSDIFCFFEVAFLVPDEVVDPAGIELGHDRGVGVRLDLVEIAVGPSVGGGAGSGRAATGVEGVGRVGDGEGGYGL